MNRMTLIGIVLIIVGIGAIAYDHFTYIEHEKVIDIGPLQATVSKERHDPFPRILGGVAVAVGIVLLIFSLSRSRRV